MVRNWAYLLFDNLEFWLPFIPRFNQAIRLKCSDLGCQYDDLKIFGFIDNTLNSTCRPGGGPACDGENAPRNDPDIQRAYYTGWKKMHGQKFKTVDLPNGMNGDVFGPVSCRQMDKQNLIDSHINDRLGLLQQHEVEQYQLYGDGSYITPELSHIQARHPYLHLTLRQRLENSVRNSCRVTVDRVELR
jgi:hypothetical protein